ncbi:MAG: DedA family protein [Patescibacteria group bacterium]
MSGILHELFTFASGIVEKFGYFGIWLGMTIESAAIPLPSEAIMGFAGFFVSIGKLNLFLAALAGAIGNITGSTIMYVIGYKGGKPLVLKYGGKFGVSEKEFEKGQLWLEKYGDKAVFFSQLLPVVRTYVSLPPGVLKMNYPKFITYTFLGALLWCFSLAYAASLLGQHWMDLEKYMKGFQYVVIAGVLGIVIGLGIYKFHKER